VSSVALSTDGLVVTAHTPNGDQLILDHVSIELQPGQIVGIVGESGSGKTTLVRAVTGLLDRNLEVTHGSVELLGRPVLSRDLDRTRDVRGRHVGVVFQDASRSLNPVLKIGTQLREVIAAHQSGTSRQAARARMREILSELAISDPDRILGSFPHQLSGGQRQRAALALAMITRPEIVLADECTTALDVTTQADVVALLRLLVDAHGTALAFVTHDLLLAADLCDRIIVMYGGQVVEAGPASEVLVRPRHPYTDRLLKAIPSWDTSAPIRGIPGSAPAVTVGFRGCRFADRCPRAEDDCRATDVPITAGPASHAYRCLHPVGAPVASAAAP
jgi:peptide/nickel transport system ATP-binding protein